MSSKDFCYILNLEQIIHEKFEILYSLNLQLFLTCMPNLLIIELFLTALSFLEISLSIFLQLNIKNPVLHLNIPVRQTLLTAYFQKASSGNGSE